jgi:transcription termination/antitermination protein NusG
MDCWYIVQTNPNNERKAAREMRRRGFGVHIPRAAVVRRHHRTKKPIMKRRPLMTGYLFLRFKGPANWYRLRQCQGVKGVLYVDGHPFRLAHEEVVAIIRAQRDMAYDDSQTKGIRRQLRRGSDDVSGAARKAKLSGMQPGRHITVPMSAGERVLARVEAITKKGTVKAVVLFEGREVAVEVTDLESVEMLDEADEAA